MKQVTTYVGIDAHKKDLFVAMLIGAIIAIAVYARQKVIGFRNLGGIQSSPLETAGVIILITSAGGAFGPPGVRRVDADEVPAEGEDQPA